MEAPKVFDTSILDAMKNNELITLCGLKGSVVESSLVLNCYYVMNPSNPGAGNSQFFVNAGIIDKLSNPGQRNSVIEEYILELLGPAAESYVRNGYFPELPLEMFLIVLNDLEMRYAMKNGYNPIKASEPNVIKAW